MMEFAMMLLGAVAGLLIAQAASIWRREASIGFREIREKQREGR